MSKDKNYKTIESVSELRDLIVEIRRSPIIGFDIETTGLNPRKSDLIGFSVSTDVGNGYYLPTLVWNAEKQVLEDYPLQGMEDGMTVHDYSNLTLNEIGRHPKTVMHNGAFDISVVHHRLNINLLDSLWSDTILMIHTIREDGPFALKDNAVLIQEAIGFDASETANQEQIEMKASVKANGGSITKKNFEMFKANLPILAKYACADTDLTLRLYYYYLSKIKEEGLEKFFFEEEVMPIYKELTIPMELNGIKLDMPLLKQTEKELIELINNAAQKVQEELTKLPEVRNWVIDKALAKFNINPKGKFGKKYVELFDTPLKLEEGQNVIKKTQIDALPEGSLKDFFNGDVKAIPQDESLKVLVEMWKDDNDGYFVNIGSSNQLAEILFDYVGEPPLTKTKKGAYQFNDETIEHFSDKYKWMHELHVYNKMCKIKSTYVDRLLKQNEDGYFYPFFKQFGTVSGRYSSNLQQLPRPLEEGQDDPLIVEYTNRIRAFFVSEEGWDYIDCDYESLEPRIFASISDDKNLQEIFDKGHDFYSTVAIRTEKLEGVSADKKADNYLKRVNPALRQTAKGYSLGIAYGMSPFALTMSLGVSKKEGARLHAGYLEGFPGVANWIEESRAFTKANGYIKNKLGRTRHLSVVKVLYEKFGDKLYDWRFRKELALTGFSKKEVDMMYGDYRHSLNNCLNFQIQSMAASVVNRAGVEINRYMKANNIPGQVIAQIHDQLVIHTPVNYSEELAKVVQDIMETTTTLDSVTLKAPPAIAKNMRDGH